MTFPEQHFKRGQVTQTAANLNCPTIFCANSYCHVFFYNWPDWEWNISQASPLLNTLLHFMLADLPIKNIGHWVRKVANQFLLARVIY